MTHQPQRRRFGRRKSDRAILWIAILAVFALYSTYTNACNGARDTITNAPETVVAPPPEVQHPEPQVITPAPEPAQGDGQANKVEVVCTGNPTVCTFTNNGLAAQPVNGVCTPPLVVWVKGSASDWGRWDGVVPGKGTIEVTPYEICDPVKIGIDLCEGGKQNVQIDLRYGTGDIHIGHWGLRTGPLSWEPNEEYCECKPGEWEIVQSGEPYSGEPVECPLQAQNGDEKCYECYEKITDVVESNGCERRERSVVEIERREVECPPKFCYYEVDCSVGSPNALTNFCQQLKEKRCEETGWPYFGPGGSWANWFGEGEGHEQCRVDFPGFSSSHFQLIPGQSAPGCLTKHQHED